MHVVGMYEHDQPYKAIAEGDYGDLDPDTVPLITHEMPDRPDGPYAVSKIFGEALGRYFWEDHRISVICIRFGTTAPDDRPGSDARSLVSYFSHRDIAAMVEACIEAENVGFDIFYGASANTWKIYDTPRAWQVPRLPSTGQRRILPLVRVGTIAAICPLSPGERVRVRGNGSIMITPTSSRWCTLLRHPTDLYLVCPFHHLGKVISRLQLIPCRSSAAESLIQAHRHLR